MANTGKLLIVGATAVVTMLIVANAEVRSDARAYTAATRHTADVADPQKGLPMIAVLIF